MNHSARDIAGPEWPRPSAESGSVTAVEVAAAEFRVRHGAGTLICVALGSCICLALWDPDAVVGGMAHIVLPDSGRYQWQDHPAMFADRAPAAVVAAMQELGARAARIRAKIVGGATIFVGPRGDAAPILEIGRRNTDAVIATLNRLRLPIAASDLGGTRGRTATFSVRDGRLLVRTTDGVVQEL